MEIEHPAFSPYEPLLTHPLKKAWRRVVKSSLRSTSSEITRRSITNVIKIGLIGCGARGTGAAAQALKADPNTELVAVADVDEHQIQKCLACLQKMQRISRQLNTAGREYVGLDAYAKVVSGDVDLVMLTTPPAFRPLHLAACIRAGKHVFCEKPVATDALGVQSALDSAQEAAARNLSLVGGLCMRYSPMMQDMFQALAAGVIGRISAYHATYFTCPVRPILPESARSATMSDTEWQIRNWYNFVWLSGDSLVEQAIHSLDRISWALDDQPPLRCIGSGGRTVPTSGGNIYDHFSVIYTYPNGMNAILNSRQIEGCHNCIVDRIVGTEGTCTYGHGPYPVFHNGTSATVSHRLKSAANGVATRTGAFGAKLTAYAEQDMYQAQQNSLLAAIRSNRPINDGSQLALSTRLAIMGRTAAYTGQEVTWDQMLKSSERLVPEHLEWHSALPVTPYAQPGRRKHS